MLEHIHGFATASPVMLAMAAPSIRSARVNADIADNVSKLVQLAVEGEEQREMEALKWRAMTSNFIHRRRR